MNLKSIHASIDTLNKTIVSQRKTNEETYEKYLRKHKSQTKYLYRLISVAIIVVIIVTILTVFS